MKLADVTKNVTASIEKHSPEILTGFGIAGMLSAIVLAAKATPKAVKLMDAKKEENGVEKLKPIDSIKTTWKCYIPAATLAIVSTGCLIGATKVSLRRNAVLATAYKIAETAHKEYREKVIETIGEKKEKVVKEKIAQDKVEKNPVSSHEVILTNNGDSLCYEPLSGRYFKGDIEKIKRTVNELNLTLLNHNYVSLNDFYDAIGLKPNKLGEDLGWNIDNGMIELDLRPTLADNDQPCAVIDFDVVPKYDFYKLY